MMREAILNFPKQFRFRPKVENGPVKKYKKYIVAGMGGSPLPAQILKALKPELNVAVHKNYGLPVTNWKGALLVTSSYSGNTEETLDAFNQGLKLGLPMAAIAVGGKLVELARANNLPFIQIPSTGIQPRSALGFMVIALLKIMKDRTLLKDLAKMGESLNMSECEQRGKATAERLKNKVPVIYSSEQNLAIAYNWKIKFNETGKIPAFYNFFPELNHNEMHGFDIKDSNRALSEAYHFIFLRDSEDHPRILKRLEVTKQLLVNRQFPVEVVDLTGETRAQKVFSSLLVADWAALYIGEHYGVETEQVPMVEEFKKLIK